MNNEFYVKISQVQEILDQHYQRNAACMNLSSALTCLKARHLYLSVSPNAKIIESLYHLNTDDFIAGIQGLYLEADPEQIRCMEQDSSHFISDEVSVFMENCFHHTPVVPHCHRNFEVLYIFRGEYEFTFQDETMHLSQGDIIIISRNATHCIREISDASFSMRFFMNYNTLSFSFFSILESHDILADFFKGILTDQNKPNYLLLSTGNNERIRLLAQSMFLEQYKYDNYSPECSLCWLKLFFSNAVRDYSSFHQFYECSNKLDIEPILDYIRKNYKVTTLSDIAAHFNYSVSYLSTIIRKTTGKSYLQTIQDYKLSEAKSLLEKTSKSIKEISGICGYNDVDHFSKTFHKVYHLSPLQYRKLYH